MQCSTLATSVEFYGNLVRLCLLVSLLNFLYRFTNRDGKSRMAVQAHSGDINGIAVGRSENDTLVASCGRDRVVQLYRTASDGLELIQTLDDHAATVGDVLFTEDGSNLLSISSDRTVLVRKIARVEGEALAFLPVRVITLKATPVSFSIVPLEPETIIVSTMDRQVQRYDTRSGKLLSSFRVQDPSNGETVPLNSLELLRMSDGKDERIVLFGASSVDRAIRMHDCTSGLLLCREQGQTAVSAIKVISKEENGKILPRLLISCGLDGTVSIWDVSKLRQGQDSPSRAESPLKQIPVSNHPARKTLSQAEVRKFQKSLESEDDGLSPIIRSPSPSRIRKKTSRYSMVDARRSSLAPLSTANSSPTPASRNNSGDQSPSPAATKNVKTIQSRHPSLDHRRRSKSAANLNDLNDSAEKLTKFLRAFRERVESSVSDKLNPNTLGSLENELNMALMVVGEKNNRVPTIAENLAGESLDTYLAKMIDERLALREKCAEAADAQPKTPMGENCKMTSPPR